MPEPSIPSEKEFKQKTSPKLPHQRGRGKSLQVIDALLRDLDQNKSATLAYRTPTVESLTKACQTWTTGKSQGKTNSATSMRKPVVDALQQTAWNWLQYAKFESQKKVYKGTKPVRSLRPGYNQERNLYLQGGKKANPISGSYMHDLFTGQKQVQHSHYSNKTFDTLTAKDFQNLDTAASGLVADPHNPGEKVKAPRAVLFLNKGDRIKILLMIDNGKLYDSFNHTYDSGFSAAYAIDEYGNIYSTGKRLTTPNENFNHSTLNAGKDVICAGMISVDNGVLKRIDNNSGHYKPTRVELHNAVQMLSMVNVDLSQCRIDVHEPNPNKGTTKLDMVIHEYNNALTFLNNANAPPDNSIPFQSH